MLSAVAWIMGEFRLKNFIIVRLERWGSLTLESPLRFVTLGMSPPYVFAGYVVSLFITKTRRSSVASIVSHEGDWRVMIMWI